MGGDALLCKAQAQVNERRQQDGERPAAPAAAPAAASLVATCHDAHRTEPNLSATLLLWHPKDGATRNISPAALKRRKRGGGGAGEGGGSRAP